jgi:hypothetical protein
MTDKQSRFVELFRKYMEHHEAYAELAAYVDALRFADVTACIESYLAVARDYVDTDKNALAVFAKLVTTALDKGDPYYALRVEVLIGKPGTPWAARHGALGRGQRDKIAALIRRRKLGLSVTQRRFIEKFADYMRQPASRRKELSDFIFALRFPQLHECLLAYVEVSTRYADDDRNSLTIFWGLSSLALAKGDPYFAASYDARVKSEGSVWAQRFQALGKGPERDELSRQIATRRKGMTATVTAAPADPGEAPSAPATRAQREFTKLFEAFMGSAKADPKALTDYVFKLGPQQKRECMTAYLKASEPYGNDNVKSLYVFFGLASLVLAQLDGYYANKFNVLVHTPGTPWARRYAGLEGRQRGVLEEQITTKTNIKRTSLMDDLKFAYFLKHHRDPTIKALQAFELDANADQRQQLHTVLGSCNRAYVLRQTGDFLSRFDEFIALLNAQPDGLSYLAMLKWCREAPGLQPELRDELYWYAVGKLYLQALVWKPTVYHGRGFNDEETLFLLGVESRSSPYFRDFEKRLDAVTRLGQGPALYREVARAHAALMLFADVYGGRLVPMDEAARVRNLVETLRTDSPETVDALRIPVRGSRFALHDLRIGQTIGDVFIVWWDSRRSEAYVEINGFDRVLFRIDSYDKLGRIKENDAIYGEVWRSTKPLLSAMPVFWDVIGFLPDLVSGGFTGLVKSVIVNYGGAAIAEAAFGDSMTGNILTTAALGALVHHGPAPDDVDVMIAREAIDQMEHRAATGAMGQLERGIAHQETRITSPDRLLTTDQPRLMLPPGRVSASAELAARALRYDPITGELSGITGAQVEAIAGVLTPFPNLRGCAEAWHRVVTANAQAVRDVHALFGSALPKREIAREARRLFNDVREEFWMYVGTSQDLAAREMRDQLSHAGFQIGQDGTAPVLLLGGRYEFRLDVDHIKELGQHPAAAFSATNLQLAPSRENRVALNQLMSQDPHQVDVRLRHGRGTSRAGKLIGDPTSKGSSPKRGLLIDPAHRALSEQAQSDAQAAIDEALRRLEAGGLGDVF